MWFAALALTAALNPAVQQPVPQPFPRPGGGQPSRPTTPPRPPAPSAPPPPPTTSTSNGPTTPPSAPVPGQPGAAPSEAALGVPVYPGAQFLVSYDAGRGQRYYIFGSVASFVDLVSYYRSVLKQKGELVFDIPATHQFDVGKFNEDTMAFPPGVTIKDFQSDVSQGYPNPKPGGQPTRFPSIIQIVPAAATAR